MTDRWGLTLGVDPSPDGDAGLARRAEELGYTDIWNGEVSGADGMASMATLAAATTRVGLGTGIVNVYSRTPMLLAMGAATVQAHSGGRFALGLGTSSHQIVEDWHGLAFDRPLGRVRQVVSAVRDLLEGCRVDRDGDLILKGARLAVAPAVPVPILVAALGPSMLRLAGEVADGSVLNFIRPEDLPPMLEEVKVGAERADRPTGRQAVVRLFVPYPGDDEQAIDGLRDMIAAYAAAPVYGSLLRRMGFSAQVDASLMARAARDRRAARRAIDDGMVASLTILGTPEEQRSRVEAYVAAGADVPVLAFFHRPLPLADRVELTTEAIERLAPTRAGTRP